MSKCFIIFEDKENNVIIETENVIRDNPTLAQELALVLFNRMREETKKVDFPKGLNQKLTSGD